MTTSVNPQENLAIVRMLEFLSERSPWNRSLWGIGIVLALEEVYEAYQVMAQGHLSEGSVKQLISSLNKRVGNIPFFLRTKNGCSTRTCSMCSSQAA